MRRSDLLLGLLVGAASLTMVGERQAAACGGCFHPPPTAMVTPTDITDERMLLSVSPPQTTLYDQIQYSGNPSSFAWVLPIHGTVAVGLSADVLFDTVDSLTATQINAPVPDCPPPPDCGYGGGGFGEDNGATAAPRAAAAAGTAVNNGVVITKQQNVGPYATVQLHSTSPTALNDWLTTNGYDIPTATQTIIAAYVNEGFDFLAMKLLPTAGVQAMRPVRVTMPGASVSLPLRMAAIGTGATVGITVWVVSDGRYQPQNFPFFHIEDSELIWDWSVNSSNYTSLRASHEAALGGKGWEIESSLSLAEDTITGVIESGGLYYPGGGGQNGAAYPPPVDASEDYIAGTDASGNPETPDQVRTDDVTDLFAGMNAPNVTVTRIRSDISHAAMSTDFVLAASPDQSQLTNIRNVTQQINVQCPIYSNDCSVIGYGTPSQSQASVTAATGGGSPGGTFACNTTSTEPVGGPAGLGAAAALLGLVVTRMRKRRAEQSGLRSAK